MTLSTILIETLGLIASILIIISFLSNDVSFIRKVNLVGCILFLAYGLLIVSISIILINIILFGIHMYKLAKVIRDKKSNRGLV
ncbi:hypothetical protein PBI_SCTP2_27 [Salicola phage SCTP-2]|nr:hypothetical protein PBI_SCTP2_27 [Salicola phage SCTP-2]